MTRHCISLKPIQHYSRKKEPESSLIYDQQVPWSKQQFHNILEIETQLQIVKYLDAALALPFTLRLCELHELSAGVDHGVAGDLKERGALVEVLHPGGDAGVQAAPGAAPLVPGTARPSHSFQFTNGPGAAI